MIRLASVAGPVSGDHETLRCSLAITTYKCQKTRRCDYCGDSATLPLAADGVRGDDTGCRVKTKTEPLFPLAMRMPWLMYVVSIHPVGLRNGKQAVFVR